MMSQAPDGPALFQASEALTSQAIIEGSLARSRRARGEINRAAHHQAKAENLWQVARFLERASKGEAL